MSQIKNAEQCKKDLIWLMEHKAEVTGEPLFKADFVKDDINTGSDLQVIKIHETIKIQLKKFKTLVIQPCPSRDGMICFHCLKSYYWETYTGCDNCTWAKHAGDCDLSSSVYQKVVSNKGNITGLIDIDKCFDRFKGDK
jgi:hypothetical protein